MTKIAYISEIFSSLQGEGPHTGEPMTFVRFSGCSLGCRWCDTEASAGKQQFYSVENSPGSKNFVSYKNPATAKLLNEHLAYFADPAVSITGGEPLEQADFLAEWLPSVTKKKLLETNGVLHNELEKVARLVDIISMDIKLPSSTGRMSLWQEHAAFLKKAVQSGKELYIKVVATSDTSAPDIQELIKVVSSVNRYIPVILQPASATERFQLKISEEEIRSLERLCKSWLPNVSVMRQIHKELGLL